MSAARKDLAALFKRLHGMGIEAALAKGEPCPYCDYFVLKNNNRCKKCAGTKVRPVPINQRDVLQVLGEMMTADTGDVTMSDVLAAAKRAGVY